MVVAMTSNASHLKEALRDWALAVTDDAGELVADAARIDQGIPRETGELARSIRARPARRFGDRMETGLTAGVIQAATTDKGARPHVIRAKRAGGRLVFYWPKVGRVVGYPSVNHPGNQAQHWWEPFQARHWPQALREAAGRRRL